MLIFVFAIILFLLGIWLSNRFSFPFLCTEITRITNDLLKENNSDDNAKLEARLDAIVDVKNDLLSRLGERE